MRILFLRSNPVDPDPRVEKAAAVLVELNHEVQILAWDRRGGAKRHERRRGASIQRLAIPGNFGQGVRNLLPLVKWNLAIARHLLRGANSYDVVHACDFDCVWPAAIARFIKKKPFVYDIFDFYADGFYGSRKRNLLSRLIRRLDFFAMRLADTVIVADDSRREQIRGATPQRLEVIYNSPEQLSTSLVIDPGPRLRVLFAGVLYNNRGIKEMADVVAATSAAEMAIAGFGGDEDDIRAYVNGMTNVDFIGKIDYAEVMRRSASADLLFATYDPIVPNHRYSSANKLFEAMMLGKPIIVAHNTGMDNIVANYKLGFVVPYGSREALDECIRTVSSWTADDRKRFAQHTRSVYEAHFAWSRMSERLRDIYTNIERRVLRRG